MVFADTCVNDFAGSWFERIDEQKAHENSAEMDEGEAEAETNMQPRRASQTVFVHNLVYKT